MPGGSGQPIQDTRIPTKYALWVQFSLFSEEEIKRMSVAEINNDQGIDNRTKLPTHGGIHDTRMGTMDRSQECKTCGCDYNDCPGHFGHISLAQPVFHPGYVNHVYKILRCICNECGRLRLRDKKIREQIGRKSSAHFRWKRVYQECQKIKLCAVHREGTEEIGCNSIQPVYIKDGLQIYKKTEGSRGIAGAYTQHTDPKSILTPEEVHRILKKIPNEDLKLMGMDPKWARPEWMVIKALAVAPPPVRPSVEATDGMRSNDDLTYGYTQVIRTNNDLKKLMDSGGTDKAQMDLVKNLQLLVATLMDNNQPDQPKQKHMSGRPIKCIRSRIKSKEGRVRGNLMGKRVDFSARTVITPDPILQLDQLGVPEMIAMNLTVPEYVTRSNMDRMRQLVKNGPNKWPGAKYIIRTNDGKQRDLDYQKNNTDAHLDLGYIVERHLRDGDYVIFNRQPSLHKMSLMGHRVKVLPFQTFRLNLAVTSPYNADFDGDEMNMHVPQSYETMAEIKEIMAVPRQIIAPKDNKPVMGIVQDSLLGIMLLTTRDTFLELDQVMNLLMWFDFEKKKDVRDGRLPPPAIVKSEKGPLWTGKQILSLVLPKVNYSRKDNSDTWACPDDNNVYIKHGELLCGILKKDQVGAKAGGLVHICQRDLGPEETKIFISDTQNLVNNWLVHNGFSVGVQDIVSKSETVEKIQGELEKYKRKAQRITQEFQRGKAKLLPGKGMMESFEQSINQTLQDAINSAGGITHKSMPSWNRLSNMVTSGSKGSKQNISQIMACVGQQNVEGQRIRFGFHRRSLPHFSKDDFGLDSKGFVSSCYFFGLTPQEFYFHAMGGREGLIDTACKTAETGYIQRRLMKTLEDLQVRYDMTVRTAKDQIVQFLYGEDGMSAEFIENQKLALVKYDNSAMDKNFRLFRDTADREEKKHVLRDYLHEMTVDHLDEGGFEEMTGLLREEYDQLMQDRQDLRTFIFKDGENSIALPVNVHRLLWNARETYRIKRTDKTDLDPAYVIKRTQDLLNLFNDENTDAISVYQKNKVNISPLFMKANEDASWIMKIYLRQMLSAKHIIGKQRLTRQSFDWLVGEIQTRFRHSLVHPGEMVGSIAAQSIGEPATQMTLNTFHMAGVASKNMTQGVPRLKEIINVATTIKTPSLTIKLEEQYRKDIQHAHEVGNFIEFTNLGQVVANSSIYYDPEPKNTIIKVDQDMLDFYNDTAEHEVDEKVLSPWMIRFEIDADKLDGKELSMARIEDIIRTSFIDFKDSIEIIRSFDGEDRAKHVLRLRPPDFSDEEDMVKPVIRVKEFEDILLQQIELKGFREITKVSYTKESQVSNIIYYDENGKQCVSKENWMIETDGVALKKCMAVDKVDFSQVHSNNIQEILAVLGIEAARKGLMDELNMILASYGVNYRHLATLVDIMTTRGKLMSITRHGINRVDDAGALRKCSFEETVEILLEASQHAEVDPLAGVTENIILGQLAPYGTGAFEVMMDCQQLATHAYQDQYRPVNPVDDMQKILYPNNDEMTPMMISPLDQNFDGFAGGEATEYKPDAFTPAPSVYESPVSPYAPNIGGDHMSSPVVRMASPTDQNAAKGYSHTNANQIPTTTGYGLYGPTQDASAMSPFAGGANAPAGVYSPIPGMGMGTNVGGGQSPFAMYSPSHNPAMSIGGMNTPYTGMGQTYGFGTQNQRTGAGAYASPVPQMPLGNTNADDQAQQQPKDKQDQA